MNYELRIIGFKDTLGVERGDALKERWEEYKKKKIKDELVEVDGWSGMLSDIKSFRQAQSLNSDNPNQDKSDGEYRKELYKFRSLSSEEKSQRLGFFRIVYFGFTGKCSEEVTTISGKPIEDLAKSIQKKFFEENPKRMFCDPMLFKSLIKSAECENSAMRIIENQIRQDKFAVIHL